MHFKFTHLVLFFFSFGVSERTLSSLLSQLLSQAPPGSLPAQAHFPFLGCSHRMIQKGHQTDSGWPPQERWVWFGTQLLSKKENHHLERLEELCSDGHPSKQG